MDGSDRRLPSTLRAKPDAYFHLWVGSGVQHRAASPGPLRRGLSAVLWNLRRPLASAWFGARQEDHERRAGARAAAVCADASAVQFHEGFHQRKPDPQAARLDPG